MEIKRRRLLQLLGATALLPLLPPTAHANGKGEILLASAADGADGTHWLLVVNQEGGVRLRHALPDRAHHVAAHPNRPWVAVVARRPGFYIDIVDYSSGAVQHRITPDTGRSFYGHAIFSLDGRYLLSTEMARSSGAGRISVRDLEQDARVAADWASGGIGPHELLLSPDGDTLVVANGGILTDGRDKLNIAQMQPSLAYLDRQTGTLLEQHYLPPEHHQLSIRHIDINAQGQVIIALQYEGDPADDKPLVALHRRGEPIRLLRAPDPVNRRMVQYCGSARFDRSGRIAAVSAPRGNLVTFWDVAQGAYLGELEARDGCGLSATAEDESFIVTTGRGQCYALYPREGYREPLLLPPPLQALAWDNHLALFSARG